MLKLWEKKCLMCLSGFITVCTTAFCRRVISIADTLRLSVNTGVTVWKAHCGRPCMLVSSLQTSVSFSRHQGRMVQRVFNTTQDLSFLTAQLDSTYRLQLLIVFYVQRLSNCSQIRALLTLETNIADSRRCYRNIHNLVLHSWVAKTTPRTIVKDGCLSAMQYKQMTGNIWASIY